MLRNTFCHIPGIGARYERRLWEAGILTWEDFLARADEASIPRLPARAGSIENVKALVAESVKRLDAGNPIYFSTLLPAREQWRIFSEFRGKVAYLDIETNGYMGPRGYITAISLYDGTTVHNYVKDRNLDSFRYDIQKYRLIVTYNGKCFDLPFIESHFGMRLNRAHLDLRYILADLGFKGGLKGCEKLIGIDRGELAGVDGYFAVLLWRDFKRNRNPKALETLLAYNVQDVVNLEPLMVTSYNMMIERTPFTASHLLKAGAAPSVSFRPDMETIDRIRTSMAAANP